MILDHCLHWCLNDAAQMQAFLLQGFNQRLLVNLCDTAVEPDGQRLPTFILHDVAAQERAETLFHESIDLRVIEVLL